MNPNQQSKDHLSFFTSRMPATRRSKALKSNSNSSGADACRRAAFTGKHGNERETFDVKPPTGYSFLPAGNGAITRLAKKLTAEAVQDLWKVFDTSTKVRRSPVVLGYHIPVDVLERLEVTEKRKMVSLYRDMIF
jgi:hypothetical protein